VTPKPEKSLDSSHFIPGSDNPVHRPIDLHVAFLSLALPKAGVAHLGQQCNGLASIQSTTPQHIDTTSNRFNSITDETAEDLHPTITTCQEAGRIASMLPAPSITGHVYASRINAFSSF
jgi:hypothetical protein